MSTSDDADGDLEVIDLASRVESAGPRRLVAPGERKVSGRGSRLSADGTPRRSPLWPIVIGVLVVILWCGVAVFSVFGIQDDVEAAQADLESARDLLTEGEIEQAATEFGAAGEVLGTVRNRTRNPLVWPVRVVPGYRRTLDAVGALGAASADVAFAAEDVADALGGAGGLGQLTPRDGRLPLEAVAELSPVLREAADTVDEAAADVRDVTIRGVDDRVVDARQQLLDILGPTAGAMRTGVDMAELVPGLFGADGPRRYLVLASNPTENRGTGGFLGAYSVMEAVDGELSFGRVGETQTLPPAEEGDIEWPDPSLARWDPFNARRSFRQMNLTPDFPSAAQVIEQYWSAVMGETLDGVIAVDPFAFQALLSVSGPVELGEDRATIGPDRVVQFVSYDAYGDIQDPGERKRLIGEVAAASFQGFLNGPGDVSPGQVLDALGDMVERDSLLIHAVRPEEQSLLREVGLSGTFEVEEGEDLLAVKLNNQAGSKVDYFLRRTLRYDVELQGDGSVSATVSAGFENAAPRQGELRYIVGPEDVEGPYSAGDNVAYVSVYCAPGCTFGEVPDATPFGDTTIPTVSDEQELGLGVASSWILLESLQSIELLYGYEVPDGWSFDGADQLYRLRYEHQTAIEPTSLTINVRIPRGFEPVDLPEGAEVADRQVVVEAEATRDLFLDFRFTPID